MIRQAAFEKNGNAMLKGGLHCHTTRSDGSVSPDEVIRMHKANGYDFLSLTDHRFYNYENYAPETGIIIVPGMEMDRSLPGHGVHCFHIVSIGPSSEDGNGFAQDQRFETGMVHNQSEMQPVLDMLHEANNLTIYCHPEWSHTLPHEFDQLQGNFAMELWNSGCVIENDEDTDNGVYWDELLNQGQKIYGVATDDGHAADHHCKGWVRVNAAKDLNSILASLKNGAFYASSGPEIYDFFIDDDGAAVVECSPAASIRLHCKYLPTRIERGEGIIRARFVFPEALPYVRATVLDGHGGIAWTNPIFLRRYRTE